MGESKTVLQSEKSLGCLVAPSIPEEKHRPFLGWGLRADLKMPQTTAGVNLSAFSLPLVRLFKVELISYLSFWFFMTGNENILSFMGWGSLTGRGFSLCPWPLQRGGQNVQWGVEKFFPGHWLSCAAQP